MVASETAASAFPDDRVPTVVILEDPGHVESAVGEGSSFTFALPRDNDFERMF